MRLALLLIAVAITGLALGMSAPGAQAHANLERSQPEAGASVAQSPVEVLLWFSEPIEFSFSQMWVVGEDGNRVDNDDFHLHFNDTNSGITVKPNLPPGVYTVIWKVLSAVDGHRTAGSFAFSVGVAAPAPGTASTVSFDTGGGSGPPRWLSVLSRWLNFAAMAVLIGAVSFPMFVLPAGLRRLNTDAGEDQEAYGHSLPVTRMAVLASVIWLALATVLALCVHVWSASGSLSPGDFSDVIQNTRFGDIWILRAVLIFGIAASSQFLFRAQRREEAPGPPTWRDVDWALVLVLALAVPATTSLISHAAASNHSELRTFIDWLHLVAGGFWIGGLVQLLLLVPTILSRTERRAEFLAGIVPRFSLLALASVAVIVTTGIVQSLSELDGVGHLVNSNYGYTLLAKVLLLTPLVGIGAFNLLIVGPRFLSFARERVTDLLTRALRWETHFRMAVVAEVAIAIAILAVTAVLTETRPPTSAQSAASASSVPGLGGVPQTQEVDDLKIVLVVDPGKAGANDLSVVLQDTNGDERAVQRVILRFTYKGQDLGTTEDDAQPLHPQVHYVLNTSQLSLPGEWEIQVIVRREGLLDARTSFTVPVEA